MPWLRELCGIILAAGVCEHRRWHFSGDDLFAPFDRAVGLPLEPDQSATGQPVPDTVDHLVKDRLSVRADLRYMD